MPVSFIVVTGDDDARVYGHWFPPSSDFWNNVVLAGINLLIEEMDA